MRNKVFISISLSIILIAILILVLPDFHSTDKIADFQHNQDEYSTDKMIHIAPTSKHIRYTGRFQFKGDECAVFAHAGSSVEWKFSGQNCFIILRNYSTDTKTYSSNYFYVFIDDREPVIMHVVNDSNIYRFTDLGAGIHHFRLFKRTEAACGKCEFVGFMIDEDASLYQTTVFPRLKMEFIGNSITSGYGNEDSSVSAPFKPATQNHYYSYAAVCARLLNAEHHAICFSGKGVYRNYDLTRKESLPVLYPLTYPQKRHKWDFESWQADIIVLNAGTNDFAQGIPPLDSFTKAYENFLIMIRKYNHKALIIVVDGPLLKDGLKKDPVSGEPERTYSLYKTCLTKAIQEFRTKGYGNIRQFSLSPSGKLGYGANWHPSKAQHELNGKELANFIKNVVFTSDDWQKQNAYQQ